MKKALSLFLAMLMLMSVFSVSAFAATTPAITSAVAGYYGVELKWSADVSAAGYGVFRLDSSDSKGELIEDVATTSYVDKNVAYGKTYKYVVASKKDDGSFAPVSFDNAVKVTYNRVQVKKVFNNYDGVNLTWNATSASKIGYRIFRQVGNNKMAFLADVKGTSYVDTAVTYGAQYQYHIVSLGANSEFAESLESASPIKVSYNLVDLKVPTATNSGVELIWTKVDGAEGYDIYRKSNKAGDKGALIGSTTDVCKFTDKNVEKGVTYNYCVIVKGSGAKPDYANGRSVRYTVAKFLKHVNQFDGLKVEWTPVANASKYYLYKNGSFLAELTTTSYLDKDVENGKSYKYSLDVQFKNGVLATFTYDSLVEPKNYDDANDYKNGLRYNKPVCSRVGVNDANVKVHMFDPHVDKAVVDSEPSVYSVGYKHYVCAECGIHSSKQAIPQLAPKTPKIISLQNTNLGIKVTWNIVDGATHYIVYRRSTINGISSGWTSIKTLSASETSFYDKNVKTGGYYRYAVKSVRLTEYTRVAVDVEEGSKTLFWEKNDTIANSYYVYRKYDATSTKWNAIARVSVSPSNSFWSDKYQKNLVYFVDDNPNPDPKANYYHVCGALISGLGSGEYTRAVKTPVGLAVKNNTTGILFGWSKVAGATAYRVYRKLESDRYWTYMGYTENNYYPDYKTEGGNTYVYTVKAVCGGHYSDYVRDGVKITRLETPKLVSAKSSRAGITVTFEQVAGAQSYNIYRKYGKNEWVRIGKITDLKSSAYLDRSAVKGVTYKYTVRAVSGNSISSYYSGISCKDIY